MAGNVGLAETAAFRDLPSLVRHIRDGMIEDGLAASAEAINAGLCGDLATDVFFRFEEWTGLPRDRITDLDVTCFIQVDPETGFSYEDGGPFDRALLAEHWPGVVPPEGMDWDSLDRLSEDAGFSAGTHVFLYSDGLFYDAEAPDGVASFFDLPFFGRVIESWKAEQGHSPS